MSLENLTDGELLEAVRAGDSSAYGLLFERHKAAALRVARRNTPDRYLAEDAVNEAFASVLATIKRGSGPVDVFGPYLISSVARAVYRMNGRSMKETPVMETEVLDEIVPDPTGTIADFDNVAAREAFKALPDRWREVLWYLEIEEMQPREVGPLLGLSPNATVALHRRAKKGLRLGYLQQHLQDTGPAECRKMAADIPAYVLGRLRASRAEALEEHLETCSNCRSVLLQIRDVGNLRIAILPLLALTPIGQIYSNGNASILEPPSDSTSISSGSGAIGKVIVAATAGVVAVVIGLVLFLPRQDGSTGAQVEAPASNQFQNTAKPEYRLSILNNVDNTITATLSAKLPVNNYDHPISLVTSGVLKSVSPASGSSWKCAITANNAATCSSEQPGADESTFDVVVGTVACDESPSQISVMSADAPSREEWTAKLPCVAS